uniref:Ig-like domain-containing protein n=1 Tax=Myripristis murdjan TaxID=586833 RepID=A0A667WV62_9TELE
MSSSAAQEVKNLTSTEGGSITLPDPVLTLGFLLYGKSNIAVVINSEIKLTEESFRNRVFWDKNTGLFTIIGLQRNDSGSYTVDSKTKGVLTSYRLTVYGKSHLSVPQPGVNRSSVSAESCTLLCFVKKSEATTLSWYRGEEILNQSSTAASLPLTVHKHHFSSSYRCEAGNIPERRPLTHVHIYRQLRAISSPDLPLFALWEGNTQRTCKRIENMQTAHRKEQAELTCFVSFKVLGSRS